MMFVDGKFSTIVALQAKTKQRITVYDLISKLLYILIYTYMREAIGVDVELFIMNLQGCFLGRSGEIIIRAQVCGDTKALSTAQYLLKINKINPANSHGCAFVLFLP